MDFSKYSAPSKQWRDFEAADPTVAKDGFIGNDPATAAEFREKTNTARDALVAEHFARTGVNERVEFSTIQIPTRDGQTIPLRRVVPRGSSKRPLRVLVYFHGGGMLFGSETSDDHVCAEIASSLNIAVLNVVYRHTPEHKFPTQHNDAVDGFEYIIKHAEDLHIDVDGVAVFGSSAGSLPATAAVRHDLALAKKEGRRTLVSGVVLSIPWLINGQSYPPGIFAPGKSSRDDCQEVPVLPRDRVKMFIDLIAAPSADDPLLNPALLPDEAFEGWPQTGILVAGRDPLRDDGLYFAKRLEELKIRTSVHIFQGVPHNFRKWTALPAAAVFDDRTIDCVSWALGLQCHKITGWNEYQGE